MQIIIAFIIWIFGYTPTETETHEYPMTSTVIEVNTETDTVSVKNFSGFVYQFSGTEDWEIGDICSCIMSDNGTENVSDDVIVVTKYDGYER